MTWNWAVTTNYKLIWRLWDRESKQIAIRVGLKAILTSQQRSTWFYCLYDPSRLSVTGFNK